MIMPPPPSSLRKVVATDLSPVMAALEVVSVGASREHRLERHLADMKEHWRGASLKVAGHP